MQIYKERDLLYKRGFINDPFLTLSEEILMDIDIIDLISSTIKLKKK
jgi:hypothetical protein